jgi:hypothetical protein
MMQYSMAVAPASSFRRRFEIWQSNSAFFTGEFS